MDIYYLKELILVILCFPSQLLRFLFNLLQKICLTYTLALLKGKRLKDKCLLF